jgi:hypothetical protein
MVGVVGMMVIPSREFFSSAVTLLRVRIIRLPLAAMHDGAHYRND